MDVKVNGDSSYLVRLQLRGDRLFEFGRRRSLPLRSADTGYLAHCVLCELFGPCAPKPFALTGTESRTVTVLGYAPASAEGLRDRARGCADPAVLESCDLERIEAKLVPITWRAGKLLAFEVKAAPVVRMSSEGSHHKKGAEVDAFLARCWSAGPTVEVDRQAVYREWLEGQFSRLAGAKIVSLQVRGWKRERFLRRDHSSARRTTTVERPEVAYAGVLEVTDGDRFAVMLKRGIGRHRSFGLGMLLVRPVLESEC